jgi:hypothetical protein
MNISSITVKRLAGTVAVAATLGGLGTGSALADPQSHLYVNQPGGISSSAVAAGPSTPVAHSGFDWADAGIGAGVALAGAALASGGVLALRKRVSPAH